MKNRPSDSWKNIIGDSVLFGVSLFIVSIAPMRTGKFSERIGKPDAGRKSISLAGSNAAGNGFNYFCRAIGGNYVQACPCILRRQGTCGVWGWRCTGRRVCAGVTLRRWSGGFRLRRRRGFPHRRWTGKRWRRPDRSWCLLLR
jgi:hypothetical protein